MKQVRNENSKDEGFYLYYDYVNDDYNGNENENNDNHGKWNDKDVKQVRNENS